MRFYRVSRGIALIFLDHGTRRGWEVSVTPRPLFTTKKNTIPIVQEAGWAPGSVWTEAGNLASTEIRSPDRPTRSSVAIPTELPGTLDRTKQYSITGNITIYWLFIDGNYMLLCGNVRHNGKSTFKEVLIQLSIYSTYLYWLFNIFGMSVLYTDTIIPLSLKG